MQQASQAYNGFDLLCSELVISMDELTAQILENPQEILDRVKALKNGIVAMPLQDDLLLEGSESAFITSGTDLQQHLDKLIHRLAHGAELKAPPMIAPTKEITSFLQEKVKTSFDRLIKGVMKSINIGQIAAEYNRDRDLKRVAQHFSELVSLYLAKPMLLSHFLHAFSTDEPMDLIEKNTRCAFIAMAGLRNHERFRMLASADRRGQLIEMGLAMLFQDVFCLIEEAAHSDEDQEHPFKSADIAREIGLSANCVTAIRHHHRTRDADGVPILKTQTPSLLENMTTVTNAFIHCITTESLGLDINQSIYVLSYYAEGWFFAKDCVQALGQICIGERKQRIITKAFQFMEQCPSGVRPFLWDLRAEVPNRFLCQNSKCEHLTNESLTLYYGVHFDGPDEAINIPKGQYRKCGHITKAFNRWLLKLFQGAL